MNGSGFNKDAKSLPSGVELVHNSEYKVDMAHFNGFSSRASGSLGASQPSAAVLRMALERTGGVRSYTVPDELSMESLIKFAGGCWSKGSAQLSWQSIDDHKMLVELACSTTLVPAYRPMLFNRMVPPPGDGTRCVVFIVCGGFKVSLLDTGEFQNIIGNARREPGTSWEVRCDNGEIFQVPRWRLNSK